MVSPGKIEVDVEFKAPEGKVWEAISDSANLFPKIFPDQYKSIEILEGDGISVGSTRIIKYAEGIPIVTFAKEKVEVRDEAAKKISYSVIEGDILNLYKAFRATLQLFPTAQGGTLVKWSVEYEKANEEVPEPNMIQESAVKTFKDLDAYLTA